MPWRKRLRAALSLPDTIDVVPAETWYSSSTRLFPPTPRRPPARVDANEVAARNPPSTNRATASRYRVGDLLVSVAHHDNQSLEAEQMVLDALRQSEVNDLLVSTDLRANVFLVDDDTPFRVIAGPVPQPFDSRKSAVDLEGIGDLLGRLHSVHSLDVTRRFPFRRPRGLLDAFKAASSAIREWIATRAALGLSSDLLTLLVSDLQRALREFVVAQDPWFQIGRRAAICHGCISEGIFWRDERVALIGNFAHAYVGDATDDLADFANGADLTTDEEDRLLDAYAKALRAAGREDAYCVPRFFARRTVMHLSSLAGTIDVMTRIRKGGSATPLDAATDLEGLCETFFSVLERTENGLKAFQGPSRRRPRRELVAMGRPIVFEDLYLANQSPRVVVAGDAYSGKTAAASQLARFIRAAFIHTPSVARAYAFSLAKSGAFSVDEWSFDPEQEPPYVRSFWRGVDVTSEIRTEQNSEAGRRILEDPTTFLALATELRSHPTRGSVVVEGPNADAFFDDIDRRFFLVRDVDERVARFIDHRGVAATDARSELRLLDDKTLQPQTPWHVIETGGRGPSDSAIALLMTLLPDDVQKRLAPQGLMGRSMLFTR